MEREPIQRLLAVGVDTVQVANSGKRAKHRMFSVDYFPDLDLSNACIENMSCRPREQGSGGIMTGTGTRALVEMAEYLVNKHRIDAILLSSGLDDQHDTLLELNRLAPILGNPPDVFKRVRERQEFFRELRRLGINHPRTTIVQDAGEAKSEASEIGYPVVLKPIRSFGGFGVRLIRSPEDIQSAFLESHFLHSKENIIQEFVEGVHASISFMATTHSARVLTINEQLLGSDCLCPEERFAYCGNIVPLRSYEQLARECKDIVNKIASHFNLVGSNGIDFVFCQDKPYVIEVNPRFQGTLECVEEVLGLSIVESHIRACMYGYLPIPEMKPFRVSVRLILYAPRRVTVPDLRSIEGIRNIPVPNSTAERGEPLCSVVVTGNKQESSLEKARLISRRIYDHLSESVLSRDSGLCS